MKTFAGNRRLSDILSQAAAQGVTILRDQYDQGGDWIRFSSPGAYVMYNTVSGKFVGRTPDGVEFASSSTAHETEPWFQALLNFFYLEKGPVEEDAPLEAGDAPLPPDLDINVRSLAVPDVGQSLGPAVNVHNVPKTLVPEPITPVTVLDVPPTGVVVPNPFTTAPVYSDIPRPPNVDIYRKD